LPKTRSRAESYYITRNTENDLFARDSRTTISDEDNQTVRRNNEGDFDAAVAATAQRERRRCAAARLTRVNDNHPRIPESAGEIQAD
jgi:hypothetical protein